jgi:excisionase family DNA binding protein
MAIQNELDLRSRGGESVPHLVTVKEAARILSIGRSSVYELIGSGRLEVVHIGRSVRIPLVAIAAYVKQLRHPGAT